MRLRKIRAVLRKIRVRLRKIHVRLRKIHARVRKIHVGLRCICMRVPGIYLVLLYIFVGLAQDFEYQRRLLSLLFICMPPSGRLHRRDIPGRATASMAGLERWRACADRLC